MNPVSRGFKNAFRNSIRTISIILILALSIGLALSMLITLQAVEDKIQTVKTSVGTSINVSPAGARGFEGGGEMLTNEQVDNIKKIPNVASAVGTLSDRLTTENSNLTSAVQAGAIGGRFGGDTSNQSGSGSTPTRNFTPPVNLTGQIDTSVISSGGSLTLASGSQIDGSSDKNEALIGEALAEANKLSVGSTFTAYNTTITVSGIIKTNNNRFASNSVIMPLATVQKLSGQEGKLSSIVVKASSIDSVDSLVKELQTTLGESADVVSQETAVSTAIEPLEGIKGLSLFGLIAAVGSGAVIILLTMVMIVRERRREIGVLKAIGASDTNVTSQFVFESITFTALAAIIGIGFAVLAAGPITTTLVSSAQNSTQTNAGPGIGGMGRMIESGIGNIRQVTTTINWSIVIYGLGAAFIIAIIGSIVASIFITKIRPAEALRAE